MTIDEAAVKVEAARAAVADSFTQQVRDIGLEDATAVNRARAQALCVRYLRNLSVPVLAERPGALLLALRGETRWVALWDGVDLPKEHE